jgi:hypothetical protein
MKKQDLKAEIDRVWGPYSEQSICFRSLVNELEESQQYSVPVPQSYNLQSSEKTKNEYLEKVSNDLTKNVANATLSFYFTRAFFILSAWSIFSIILAAGGFLAWTFLF